MKNYSITENWITDAPTVGNYLHTRGISCHIKVYSSGPSYLDTKVIYRMALDSEEVLVIKLSHPEIQIKEII